MRPTDDHTPLDALAALDSEPEPSDYDQELGRQIGRDAIRVWNGDMSEAEFHELYEDRLREEFGEDFEPSEVTENE